jgi:hypothetical protein
MGLFDYFTLSKSYGACGHMVGGGFIVVLNVKSVFALVAILSCYFTKDLEKTVGSTG